MGRARRTRVCVGDKEHSGGHAFFQNALEIRRIIRPRARF
jgi:hypothetical protein